MKFDDTKKIFENWKDGINNKLDEMFIPSLEEKRAETEPENEPVVVDDEGTGLLLGEEPKPFKEINPVPTPIPEKEELTEEEENKESLQEQPNKRNLPKWLTGDLQSPFGEHAGIPLEPPEDPGFFPEEGAPRDVDLGFFPEEGDPRDVDPGFFPPPPDPLEATIQQVLDPEGSEVYDIRDVMRQLSPAAQERFGGGEYVGEETNEGKLGAAAQSEPWKKKGSTLEESVREKIREAILGVFLTEQNSSKPEETVKEASDNKEEILNNINESVEYQELKARFKKLLG